MHKTSEMCIFVHILSPKIMTELTLQRLTSAGWTPGRKVDISPIAKAYAETGMVMPEKLREFFTEFGFLTIRYDIQHTELERHTLNPISDFLNYSKEDFEHLFDDYEVFGTAYPVGFAYRGNMTIYYHDDGNFYIFMEPNPLYRCGKTAESLLNGLFGGDKSGWVDLDEDLS